MMHGEEWSLLALKRAYADFFIGKGYTKFAHRSIVEGDNKELLFVNAGIVPMQKVIEGSPDGRYFSMQGCLRLSGKHNDLTEIGGSVRHHTYFEMAGHFLWGKDQELIVDGINSALGFLSSVGIERSRLFITYHPQHSAFLAVAQEFGLPARVDEENVWSAGEYGYTGHCVEIYYTADSGYELELWNCVFVDRYRAEDGSTAPCEKPFLDSGMGIARLLSVLSGHFDTYLNEDIKELGALLGNHTLPEHCLRVFTDNMRSVVIILNEGVLPGPRGRGYVLRKLLRNVVYYLCYHDVQTHLTSIDYGAFYDRVFRYCELEPVMARQELLDHLVAEVTAALLLWKRSECNLRAVVTSDGLPSSQELQVLVERDGVPRLLINKILEDSGRDREAP